MKRHLLKRHLGRIAGPAAAVLAVAAGGWLGPPARATDVYISGQLAGIPGVAATLPVQSFQARRFSAVIHQQFDYSCGSAALATLLTYSYNIPVTEMQVFTSMVQHGDRQLIEQRGFSLLDMKEFLARGGLPSGGFRAPLSKLAAVGVPAIVLINERGYRHFVVVTGIQDGRVLLADPAVGTRSERVGVFENEWSGIFFLIMSHAEEARANFNRDSNWSVAPEAPISLTRFMVDLSVLRQVGAGNPTLF
jgi:uncharacterized protein